MCCYEVFLLGTLRIDSVVVVDIAVVVDISTDVVKADKFLFSNSQMF